MYENRGFLHIIPGRGWPEWQSGGVKGPDGGETGVFSAENCHWRLYYPSSGLPEKWKEKGNK